MTSINFNGAPYVVGPPGSPGTVIHPLVNEALPPIVGLNIVVTYFWGNPPGPTPGVTYYLVYEINYAVAGNNYVIYQGCVPVTEGQITFAWADTYPYSLSVAYGAVFYDANGAQQTEKGSDVVITATPNVPLGVPALGPAPAMTLATGSPSQISP